MTEHDYKKTTWIIGDIHGMFDPLKRLITEIRRNQSLYDQVVDKLIFVGDYIDYGPSSKEVIDLILDIEYPVICLAGNHEDLLMHFYNNSYFIEEYGNMWFNGNGGQETLYSFNPPEESFKLIYGHEYSHYGERRFEPNDFKMPAKYMNFFKNLKYVHVEEFNIDKNYKYKFLIIHSGISENYDLHEQIGLTDYEKLHKYIQDKKIYPEYFNPFLRVEPTKKFEDYIIINGHTPTYTIEQYYKKIDKYYDIESGLPYFRFDADNVKLDFNKSYDQYSFSHSRNNLISVNIDTAAAFGKYLTAIGFSRDSLYNDTIFVQQVATSGLHRGYRADTRSFEMKLVYK